MRRTVDIGQQGPAAREGRDDMNDPARGTTREIPQPADQRRRFPRPSLRRFPRPSLRSFPSPPPRGFPSPPPLRFPRPSLRRYLGPFLIILAGLGLWQVILPLASVPEYLLPTPSEIAADMASDWPVLEPALIVTLREIVLGFVISVALGVGLAVLLHLLPGVRRAVYPILIGSQTVPIIVLAPILVILLGYGIEPKLVIVALVCFFPIVINGIDGLRSVDSELIAMMRTLDASRWAIFRRVEFPAALPSIFSGMRVAATFAAIGAVFGEWSGANQGLGYVMLAATPNLLTERIFAAIVLLTAVALALFGLVSLLERVFVPWAPRGRG